MLYTPIRKQIRSQIINRNTENVFRLLITSDEAKEDLKKIKRVIYPNTIANSYHNILFKELFRIEQGLYNATYETIMNINILANDFKANSNKTLDLFLVDVDDKMFPHTIIRALEEIANTKGMSTVSKQKTEFEITKQITTPKEYQEYFENQLAPLKTNYESELARTLFEFYNLLLNSRKTLLHQYIKEIF